MEELLKRHLWKDVIVMIMKLWQHNIHGCNNDNYAFLCKGAATLYKKYCINSSIRSPNIKEEENNKQSTKTSLENRMNGFINKLIEYSKGLKVLNSCKKTFTEQRKPALGIAFLFMQFKECIKQNVKITTF